MDEMHATTVLCVRHGGVTAMGADGQVTLGSIVLKASAKKVRRLDEGRVLAGFAGATADAMTLFERMETKLKDHGGHLVRAAVELAKDWRAEKALRRLDAVMLLADSATTLLVSGAGDVIEPDRPCIAVGSGGPYAFAAARAYLDEPGARSASEIVRKSLEIAADLCIYTNREITVETL